jgi:hypothetical protein
MFKIGELASAGAQLVGGLIVRAEKVIEGGWDKAGVYFTPADPQDTADIQTNLSAPAPVAPAPLAPDFVPTPVAPVVDQPAPVVDQPAPVVDQPAPFINPAPTAAQ